MARFKGGDLCVIVHIEGCEYCEGATPGTFCTVKFRCCCPDALINCLLGGGDTYLIVTREHISACAAEVTLRKIEPPEQGSFEGTYYHPHKEIVT